MTKSKAEEAKKLLKKIQLLMSKVPSPYEGMSEQEAIERMRKVREKLWREKFVTHS